MRPWTAVPRRVVVLGAGAVGSHVALSVRRGVPLLVIDRDEGVRGAFAARGIEAAAPDGVANGEASGGSALFRLGDVVVLATSAAAAAPAARVVPSGTPIVCLANGVMAELAAARGGSLWYGVVEFAASCRAPGEVACTQRGWLTLERGSPEGPTGWLASVLDPRLQRARLTRDVAAHRHGKLMLNASLDPVAAVIGGTIGDVFRGWESFRAFRVLLREALAVARGAGWRLRAVQGVRPDVLSAIFAAPVVGRLAARSAARKAAAVASTLAREVGRGGMGEADHLSGAIVREGARVGVATPGHERVMEVLRRVGAEPGGGRPEFAGELLQR